MRGAALVLAGLLLAGCSDGDSLGQVPEQPESTSTESGSESGTGPSGSADPESSGSDEPEPDTSTGAATPAEPGRVPPLRVQVVTDRLVHGWDVGFLPDGRVLVSERPGRFTLLSSARPGARATRVQADLDDVYAVGEGGLLGMVLHPDFAESRLFTTCLDHEEGGSPVDVRLVTWRLSEDGSRAERVRELLTGLPVAEGGRHSGCRPEIAPDGALLVGTGDTARPGVPQDLGSLGGKVLRLDLVTGRPLPDSPYADADGRRRYVYTYGHRNVQGVAVRPGTDQVFSAEHGPDVNDEVNRLRPGANYGWDPSRGGSAGFYDESVPMTDRQRFPDAVPAIWESGDTTQAICAATFLDHGRWGGANGRLVLTALKGAKLLMLGLDSSGGVVDVAIPEATNGPYGRLRAARTGPDGALYVTTTNGEDDRLLRITPRG